MVERAIKLKTLNQYIFYVLLLSVFWFVKPASADFVIFDNLASGSAGNTPYQYSSMSYTLFSINNSIQITGYQMRSSTGYANCTSSSGHIYEFKLWNVDGDLLNNTEFSNVDLGCPVTSNLSSVVSVDASPSAMPVLSEGTYLLGFGRRQGSLATDLFIPAFVDHNVVENTCYGSGWVDSRSSQVGFSYPSGCYTNLGDTAEESIILWGGQSIYSTSRILSIYSPRTNEVIPLSGVGVASATFNFDLYNKDDYSIAGVELEDDTLQAGIDTSLMEYNFSASGLVNYTREKLLESNHLYRWRPYMRTSDYSSYVFGGWIYFSTSGATGDLISYNPDYIGSNTLGFEELDFIGKCNDVFPDTGSWLSVTTYGNAFGRGICNAFGAVFVPSSASFSEFKINVFSVKDYFPISTVKDVYEVVMVDLDDDNIASSNRFASLSFNNLDLDTTVSHSVSFTIFRMASLSEYIPQSSIYLVRNVMEFTLWFSFIIGWFYVISKIFR